MFLKDTQALQEINLRVQARVLGTISPNGEQPLEMEAKLAHRYCTFNVQTLVNLFNPLENVGLRPWSNTSGDRLRAAMQGLSSEPNNGSGGDQVDPFDLKRLIPIACALREQTGEGSQSSKAAPYCFDPHDGVPPYWRLASGYSFEP